MADSKGLSDETPQTQPEDLKAISKRLGRGILRFLNVVLGIALIILIIAIAIIAGITAISIPIAIGFGLGMFFQPWLALIISLIVITFSVGEMGLLMDYFTENNFGRWGTIALLMLSSVMFLTAVGNSPTLFNTATKVISLFVR